VWMPVAMVHEMIAIVRIHAEPTDAESLIAVFEAALRPQVPTVDVTRPANDGS
jgi:hypothetical protein